MASAYNRSSSPFMKTALTHFTPNQKPKINQMFYTFGAKTNIKQAAPPSGACTPPRPGTADNYNSTISLPSPPANLITVVEPNVERRDYTKNLSQ